MSSFLEYAQDRLKVCGPVTYKNMFGGTAIYSGNRIFGMVINDLLYFKVGPGNQAEYEAAGMAPFSYEGKNGKKVSMSYWQVPEEVIEDDEDLRFWFQRALRESVQAGSQQGKKPSASAKKAAPKKKVSRKAAPKKKTVAKKKSAPKKKVGKKR
ncbi:TfoX family protein [Leptospira fluminis]|uniref:TfoX family protein n=1 Tax=Leptospira fluminis TaxID=2484979 RepID=A0A4R9GLQ3_9LEPT|nr:TfoX/Sxy family protein [Leptospira fluminis]TGK15555.1 TfoX family protein [Leptospira fluminis]